MVHLKLPKFEITFNWDVESDLRRLGLSLPFSRQVGDLRGLCEKEDGHGILPVIMCLLKIISLDQLIHFLFNITYKLNQVNNGRV